MDSVKAQSNVRIMMAFTISPLSPKDYDQWSALFFKYALKRKQLVDQKNIVATWNLVFSKVDPLKAFVVKNKLGRIIAFSHFQELPEPFVNQHRSFLCDLYIDDTPDRKDIAEALQDRMADDLGLTFKVARQPTRSMQIPKA